METIREIVSLSHDGHGLMWYPFSIELDGNNTTISAEYYQEIIDLWSLVSSMFSTNNHSPELLSKENSKLSKKYLVGHTKKSTCCIRFKTDKHEYSLERCFTGLYSTESKLQKIDSTVVYRDEDVIQMLSKFHKPVVIDDGGMFTNSSLIFKPLDNYSRTCMESLANIWARMVGLNDSILKLDYDGKWSTSGDVDSFNSRRYSARTRVPSPLRLITNLAQVVMKKRTYGSCSPVFSPFNISTLNDFEAIAMIDLIKNVCREEGVQLIIGTNAKTDINSMIGALQTPRLSNYEY